MFNGAVVDFSQERQGFSHQGSSGYLGFDTMDALRQPQIHFLRHTHVLTGGGRLRMVRPVLEQSAPRW